MSTHRIRFEGPAELVVEVATALADADGVDLVSSEPPARLDADRVRLVMTADGAATDVESAVRSIAGRLAGGSITLD